MPVLTRSRRSDILDAALACFVESGVASASIDDVCGRSGASVGSVYHHFGDKAGVAGAVYVEALRDYQATFLDVLRRHADDAEAAVRGVVGAHLRWCLRDHPDRARFLLLQGDAARGADPDGLRELNREFLAAVQAWWRPHARYGALRDLELDLAYALWLGPAQELCRLRLSHRTTIPPGRAAPPLADAAWRALRGDTP